MNEIMFLSANHKKFLLPPSRNEPHIKRGVWLISLQLESISQGGSRCHSL